MREHLLTIQNFYFGSAASHPPALNLSVYQKELISVCSSSYLSVETLLEAYHNHLLNGTIAFSGQPAVSLSKGLSLKHVRCISQNARLISSLSITDNIFALRKHRFPQICYNVRHARIAALDLLKDLQIPIDLNTPVTQLTDAQSHLLLIAKAFVQSAKLVLLDNVTESYTLSELQFFLQFIQKLQEKGVTFLIFSNGPSLITQASDRIFVSKNFEITNIIYHDSYQEQQLVSMMLGGLPHLSQSKVSCRRPEPVMEIDWTPLFPALDKICLHRQECLCVFDVNGSNIMNLYDMLTRRYPYSLDGKSCTDYRSAIQNGLAPISFSHLTDYYFSDLSYEENLTLPILKKISTAGILNKKIYQFCVRSASPYLRGDEESPSTELIKLLLLRWQLAHPKVLLLSDLHTNNTNRRDIYEIINQINQSGSALILLSSNLYDCLYFADSLFVIKDPEDLRMFYKNDNYETFVQEVQSYLYSP